MSPAKSAKQKSFMGMVSGAKKAGKQLSGAAGKAETSMSAKQLNDFASTKTKNLPKKIKK